MNIKTAKEAIWNFEYYTNGYGRLSGMDVKVINLRLRKKFAIADVKLIDREDNHIDRYNDRVYSIEMLEKWTIDTPHKNLGILRSSQKPSSAP